MGANGGGCDLISHQQQARISSASSCLSTRCCPRANRIPPCRLPPLPPPTGLPLRPAVRAALPAAPAAAVCIPSSFPAPPPPYARARAAPNALHRTCSPDTQVLGAPTCSTASPPPRAPSYVPNPPANPLAWGPSSRSQLRTAQNPPLVRQAAARLPAPLYLWLVPAAQLLHPAPNHRYDFPLSPLNCLCKEAYSRCKEAYSRLSPVPAAEAWHPRCTQWRRPRCRLL